VLPKFGNGSPASFSTSCSSCSSSRSCCLGYECRRPPETATTTSTPSVSTGIGDAPSPCTGWMTQLSVISSGSARQRYGSLCLSSIWMRSAGQRIAIPQQRQLSVCCFARWHIQAGLQSLLTVLDISLRIRLWAVIHHWTAFPRVAWSLPVLFLT
jgi:hypothetical protein